MTERGYFRLKDGKEQKLPVRKTVLLKLSHQRTRFFFFRLREPLFCVVAKKFASLFLLLLSYEGTGEGVVRTKKLWELRENSEPLSYQLARSTCVFRIPSTRHQSQALRRESKRIRNMRQKKKNGRGCSIAKSIASIVWILQLNEFLNERVNQDLAHLKSARKRRAQNKYFQFIEYNCLLPLQSPNSKDFVRPKAQQIDEANKRLLSGDDWNGVKNFEWWR